MHYTRKIAIISLALSMLGLGQPTLADRNSASWQKTHRGYSAFGHYTLCPGGISKRFRLGGEVEESKIFTLSQLQSLPASKVTVTFLSGQGQETRTYIGVPLWQLIQSAGGLKPNPSVKNNFLRQYIVVEGTDCYQAVVAVGEIEPNFEGKNVLVAYAEEDSSNGQTLLSDEGFARLVVPGDQRGGRYVTNIKQISVQSKSIIRSQERESDF